MKSIQTKFVVLILSCVIICSCVIGFTAIHNTKLAVDDDSARFMNLQCREGTEQFNSLLARIEQSVNTLSLLALDELDSVERLKTDPTYLADYTKRMESAAVNAANNTEGALAVYIRFNPAFTPPESGVFWSKTNASGYFQKLTPTDFSSYSSTDTEHVGWYYIPIENGKPTWMEPYFNQNIQVRMVSYVIPLYKGNEVVGVVGMDIDFGAFETLASYIRLYETGYAFLCDESGRILYHPQYPMHANLEEMDPSLQPLVQELRKKSSEEHLFTYTHSGQVKKAAYRALNNGMILAITAPLQEIDASKNTLLLQTGLSILLMSILFVLVTVTVTRRLIRPLRELNAAAQKIAGGDLEISLLHSSKDEVGMLAESFRQTVKQLQKHIHYINGLAYRDALTGVKNKMAYQEVAQRLEEQIRLGQPQFAVVVMDINHLKAINDQYGHDFGDILITNACKFICKIFKHSPIYRIGGDEFVAILEHTDFTNYVQLMQDFTAAMEEQARIEPPENRVSIARGLAVYNPESDLVFSNVFKRADDAMYQNKAAMKAKERAAKESEEYTI